MASQPEQALSLAQIVDQTAPQLVSTSQSQNASSTAPATATAEKTSCSPSTTINSSKPTTDAAASTEPPKPIHALVVDAGPIIKNDPPVSTLLGQAVELWTLPSVVGEIRDAATRARVETTLLPFLKLRNPRPESVKFVQDFARRTGDLEVLSRPDLHLIALTYELECERNGGDWRLRRTPGQKGMNGKPPGREEAVEPAAEATNKTEPAEAEQQVPVLAQEAVTYQLDELTLEPRGDISAAESHPTEQNATNETTSESTESTATRPTEESTAEVPTVVEEEEDDDEDGWITPSNLKNQQAKDRASAPEQPIQKLLQAALLTSDYAMQNVSLRMNLNLVSPAFARITRVKTWVLRCHGCFQITRDTGKQFCPRCGQPTLTRVSCSTDAGGNFTVHLKKNYQWNNRGNVYSIPKPVHGSASGKASKGAGGGGKQGWGKELMLAEDQKEYLQKNTEQQRIRQKDLMDDDFLPSILTGDRRGQGGGAGKIKVGAGRNVNSKKRRA